MHRTVLTLIVLVGVASAAYGQLYDYSLIGQVTNDRWDGGGSSEFEIRTTATGIQAGQMADDGFDMDWAGTLLVPLSLTFANENGENTATFSDANFGAGLAGRFGIGYGYSPIRGLVISPGVAWHAIFNSYSFTFPGGATVYRELTHGPAVVGQIAFMLSENFGLQGGAMYGYSPFHFGGVSSSGDDEDMTYGTVVRGWLGVRIPFNLTSPIL